MSVLPSVRFVAAPSWCRLPWLLAPLLLTPWAVHAGQMHDLGIFPDGPSTQGTAISGNGQVIAGNGADASNTQWLFFWRAAVGEVAITSYTGAGRINAANYNGDVLVGTLRLNGAQRAFRWDAVTGITDLSTLGGTTSRAWGISGDGSVIVGDAANASAVRRAFRWTADQGMQDLGGLSPTGMSIGYAISADGVVVVGTAASDTGNRAVLWKGNSILDLGSVHGNVGGGALGVNADGSVVVGASGMYAFRWTAATGMVDIGSLGGALNAANDVSADGAVVVGTSSLADGTDRAFRWTAATGMVSLGLLGGGTFSQAQAISDDGSIIVGTADNGHGDRAFIWKADQLQDLDNVQHSVIGSADTSAQLIDSQVRRTRSVAEKHCIPGAAQRYCLSLGGGMTVGEGDESSHQAMGIAGAGMRVAERFAIGVNLAGAQASWNANEARQDHELGFGAWLAYQQRPQSRAGWAAVVSLATSGGDSRFERGDRTQDVQQATTRVGLRSGAERVAVSYGIELERSLLTSELALTHAHSQRRRFEERNIALPLRVDSSRSNATYATWSLRSDVPLSARATVHWGAALDALVSENTPSFEGQSEIPGLSQFALRSSLEKRDVVPSLTAGYRYALSENASVGGQAQVAASAFEQQRPVYGLQVHYSYTF